MKYSINLQESLEVAISFSKETGYEGATLMIAIMIGQLKLDKSKEKEYLAYVKNQLDYFTKHNLITCNLVIQIGCCLMTIDSAPEICKEVSVMFIQSEGITHKLEAISQKKEMNAYELLLFMFYVIGMAEDIDKTTKNA